MTLYNLADYRARRLRSRAVPLHVEALAAYEQAEAYRARHLASAHVCGWGASSESDGPAAAPPWPPATTLVPSSQQNTRGKCPETFPFFLFVLSLSSRSSRESC
jgi:hypothetical protein